MMYNPFETIEKRLIQIENLLQQSLQKEGSEINSTSEIIDGASLRRRLHISEPTEIRLRKKGSLPFLLIGNQVRYDWQKVLKALEKKQKK